jgi:hypothetical protein
MCYKYLLANRLNKQLVVLDDEEIMVSKLKVKQNKVICHKFLSFSSGRMWY